MTCEITSNDPITGAWDDEPEDAAGVIAADAPRRERQLAEIDSYSAALGVAPVRTMVELFDFMTGS